VKNTAILLGALCVSAITGQAAVIFSLTQVQNFAMSGSAANTHIEQTWDFTTLAGWDDVIKIDSITVTEHFSSIIPIINGGPNFQSAIINFGTPLGSQAAIYFLFNAQTPTGTKTTTLVDPFPGNDGHGHTFSSSTITGAGILGQFDTRVARNSGNFTLDSITIDISAEVPEPASIWLTGLALLGVAWGARRRLIPSFLTRRHFPE